MQNRTLTNIDRNKITTDITFRHRSGPDSGSHLAALRKTLRNTGRLDPVLVWQEADDKGTATGRLVLLDGHYRLAAYRAEQSAGKIEGRGIPAMLISGNRMEAHLAALMANSKDTLPLTMQERLNAAWKLVQAYPKTISKPRLARASGVSERTILSMRQQFKKFTEAGTGAKKRSQHHLTCTGEPPVVAEPPLLVSIPSPRGDRSGSALLC